MFAHFHQIKCRRIPVTYLPWWLPQILHISMLISFNRSPQVCQLALAVAATLSHEQTYLNYWQIPWSRDFQKVTVGQLVKKCPAVYKKKTQFLCHAYRSPPLVPVLHHTTTTLHPPTIFTFYSNISFPHVPRYIAFRFIWWTFCMHVYMLHVLPISSLLFSLYWQHLLWPQIYVALCIGRHLQLCHFLPSWIPPSINP